MPYNTLRDLLIAGATQTELQAEFKQGLKEASVEARATIDARERLSAWAEAADDPVGSSVTDQLLRGLLERRERERSGPKYFPISVRSVRPGE